VKPDIVLFEEKLPERFYRLAGPPHKAQRKEQLHSQHKEIEPPP
jgi:hypothetical protein